MYFKAQKRGASSKVLTVRLDLTNSDPATWGTYMDDAVGMTAGSDEFDEFFGHYPCILANGVELGKLKRNDMTKYEDGTNAPITSTSSDVMIAFPRRGIKIWSENGYGYISMTDEDNAQGYSYMAHTYSGNRCSMFYLGRYKARAISGVLYSLSGQTPSVSQPIANFRSVAQAKGTGYELSAYYQLLFRQVMYMLKYKGQNAQTAIGLGYVTGNTGKANTGSTNDKGMDWGTSTGTYQMTLFGIEDFYGNINEFVDGVCAQGMKQLYATDGNYNDSFTGYTLISDHGSSSSKSGYLKNALLTNAGGFLPDASNSGGFGTATTYYCDQIILNDNKIPMFGGMWSNYYQAGVFDIRFNQDVTGQTNSLGARIMYMKQDS